MLPSTLSEFIDRFTSGSGATNKVYPVTGSFGLKNLNFRGYIRDFIRSAQKGETVPYLDRPKLWMCHHQITDKKGWAEVMEGMWKCRPYKYNTPSHIPLSNLCHTYI